MRIRDKFWKLSSFLNLRVLYVLSVVIAVLILVDLSVFRYGFYGLSLSPVYIGNMYGVVNNGYSSNGSALENANDDHGLVKDNVSGNEFNKAGFNREDEGNERNHEVLLLGKGVNGTSFAIEEDSQLHSNVKSEEGLGIGRKEYLTNVGNGDVSSSQFKDGDLNFQSRVQIKDLVEDYDEEIDEEPNTKSTGVEINNQTSHGSVQLVSSEFLPSNLEYVDTDSGTTVSYNMSSMSTIHQDIRDKEAKPESINLQSSPIKTADSYLTRTAVLKKQEKPISVSQMNSILIQNSAASIQVRRLRSSKCDRELEKARVEIINAPIVRDVSQVYASAFRNFSMFSRSYQLMEQLLKVYLYREGEKPIFHQPYMRGIYASEGWFMKLMEANKKFVVKDAKKAHLFYLPFSSKNLRSALNNISFSSQRDLQNHLDNYVRLIANKYPFWNRTMGTDHFLVACHDWVSFLYLW
ncbi:glycosyltransferase [Lithospermum erythrorhizon]|uniref:Glycosyltransferase n=1 Tax=Lithospermum erythrorhizon TaxID=34254 RepID=A0AAV3S297_LITER